MPTKKVIFELSDKGLDKKRIAEVRLVEGELYIKVSDFLTVLPVSPQSIVIK